MSRGFTGKTQKQRRSPHIGNIHHPRGQRRHGRSAATSRFCWPFYSTPVGWCITNTHRKAKPSPKSTTRGYFVAFVMLCGANDRTCGRQNLAAPSRQCTRPFFASDSRFFWLNTTLPWFVRLPTLPTWLLVIFGCSPNWKCRWKGTDLSQEKTLCGTRQPSCTWFHKKLSRNVPAMAGPLEEVCALPRRLLWRGLGFQTSKQIIVFLPTKGPILLNRSRTYRAFIGRTERNRPHGKLSVEEGVIF